MMPMTHQHTRELDIFYKEHHEKCTNCGKTFGEGSTEHVGYTCGRKFAVLCDDCSPLLEETVVRYYHQDDPYEKPCPNDKLWRYMDLAKFISIISTKALYFASLQSFDDPFEGAKGSISRKENWDNYYLKFFREAIRTAPRQDCTKITNEEIEDNALRLLKELDLCGESERKSIFVNCWYDNEYESEAMWKLYSANNTNAIAIQTTAERLYLALNRSPQINIGKVRYIDYGKNYAPVNGSFWYKRKAFEYEREVRAVLHSNHSQQIGLSIPVDIETLIDNIYISPCAHAWFIEVVRSVMNKYDVDKPICYSKLRESPFY